MKQVIDSSKELYFSPVFFSQILQSDNSSQVHENIKEYNFDLYSEIRKHTNNNICTKFKEIRYIPLSNGELDYKQDVWDFSGYTIVRSSKRKLHFENVPESFRNDLKDFVLLLILRGNIKLSSIVAKHMQLKKFLNFIYGKGIHKISNIDFLDVKEFLDCLESTKATYGHYQLLINIFLTFYDMEYGTNVYSIDIERICQRTQYVNRVKAERKQNRRQPIPDEYFDNLINVLFRIMNDSSEKVNVRAAAAILIIDSQTGLRASELSLLEANSVESLKIESIDYRMIHYKIIKTARGNKGYFENITFINDLSFIAYEVLLDILKENRKMKNTDLLFCPLHTELPVEPNNYLVYLKKFCFLYADEIGSKNKKFRERLSGKQTAGNFSRIILNTTFSKSPLSKMIDVNQDTEFFFPVVHQFRNTVVDRLYRAGVNLEFIRRYMGHLSAEMTARYADYGDTDIQENVNFSDNVLRTYLTGDAKILGNSGKQLMQRIDEWLEQNDLNAQKNLDSILEKLGRIIPIRAKHGGMCIKGQKLTDACSVDSKTDEFFCACGVCPNVCHYYFMINVTYSDFKAIVEIYNHNLENGFTRQSEKELSKIKHLIANRFMPEIIELEREMDAKGKQNLEAKHPELKYLIEHLDEIKKEVFAWN